MTRQERERVQADARRAAEAWHAGRVRLSPVDAAWNAHRLMELYRLMEATR